MKKLFFLVFGLCAGLVIGAHLPALLARAATIPQGGALFETSLQDRISSTDTSMTLVTNALRGSEALSGFNCFTLDEGRTDQEFTCGTVSGTSVTGLTRGISFLTGTSTVSANKWAHRKGANVKVTDHPVLIILQRILAGMDTLASVLSYDPTITTGLFTSAQHLVDKAYVDGVAFGGAGIIDATTAARGVSELATGAEAAASTAQGSSGVLVLPASLATSTYNAATAPSHIPVTLGTGLLDQGFLPSTISKGVTFSGLVTVTGSTTGVSGNKAYLNTNPPASSGSASTTIFIQPIAANTLFTANYYRTTIHINQARITASGCNTTIEVGYGSTGSTTMTGGATADIFTGTGNLDIYLIANAATNSQKLVMQLGMVSTSTSIGTSYGKYASNTISTDSTAAQNLTFIANTNCGIQFTPGFITSELYN